MWRLDDDDDTEKNNDGFQKSVVNKLLKARTIILAEPVSDKMYSKVATMVTLLESEDGEAPIKVLINSPGGSADSGFAIYDVLNYSRCPIVTIANGLVASAAIKIFCSGDAGKRVSLPNARFMIHQPSTFARGQASDIDITAKEIVKMRKRYFGLVAEVTGRDYETVEQDCMRDFWMSADEAKTYGLVDNVIKKATELPS
jgi:ATP-dependent Clp protease protease subunit